MSNPIKYACDPEKVLADIDKETLFTVSQDGHATLYMGHDHETDTCRYYISQNTIEDFRFRGSTYHDGRDMWGLTEWEKHYILNAFDFEEREG